jgi:hypothetical protein
MQNARAESDRLITLGLLIVFIGCFVIGRTYPSDAKIFPMIVGIAGAIITTLHLALGFFVPARSSELYNPLMESENDGAPATPEARRRLWITIAAAPLYAAGVYVLGFHLATLMTMIALPWGLGFRSPLILLAVTLGTTAAIHLVFGTAMDMQLPHGLLGEWFLHVFIYDH